MTQNLAIEILELRRKLLDMRELVKALEGPNSTGQRLALKSAQSRLKELEEDNAFCELMFQS